MKRKTQKNKGKVICPCCKSLVSFDDYKTLKKEYQPGGSKRQYILDKAVDYLLQPGLQADKHVFCTSHLKKNDLHKS